jgi:hypothetical protein
MVGNACATTTVENFLEIAHIEKGSAIFPVLIDQYSRK